MSDDAVPLPTARLIEIRLDEASLGRGTPDIEHEREVAIYDLIEGNSFALDGRDDGPYALMLSMAEDRLVFSVGNARAIRHWQRISSRSRHSAASSRTTS